MKIRLSYGDVQFLVNRILDGCKVCEALHHRILEDERGFFIYSESMDFKGAKHLQRELGRKLYVRREDCIRNPKHS